LEVVRQVAGGHAAKGDQPTAEPAVVGVESPQPWARYPVHRGEPDIQALPETAPREAAPILERAHEAISCPEDLRQDRSE
jgi:hypothetical protein